MSRAVFAIVLLLVAAGAVWLSPVLRAAPEPRIALVIGNADYGPDIGALKNPPNDARLIANALRAAGFDVDPQFNRTKRQMKEDIRRFADRLRRGGANAVGFFYFAGHGFQHSGENYLVPIGAQYKSLADAEDQSVRANYVLDQVLDVGNRLNIVILDACRNNLFSRSRGARGLVAVKAPSNVAVGYATAPGETADDGPPNGNSPYASVLAAQISSSNDRLETVMVEVKKRVRNMTGNQEPYHDLNFGEEFRFRGTATPVTSEEQEIEAWKSLGPNPSKEELEAFLRAFPNGKFAGLARAKLNALNNPPATKPAPGSPPPASVQPSTQAAAPSAAVAGQTFRDCPQCPEMVVVPAGSFMMGSPPDEADRSDNEGPQHKVTIPRAFAVGKFEVTFVEWDACVAAGGCRGYRPGDQGWGRGKRPVIRVSWNDTKDIIAWLSRTTGRQYRLLSEAEWEYAARAGTVTPYSFGGTISASQARFGSDKTADVGSYPANLFGLYDMHGNVWEWVEDCYHDSYAGAPVDGRAWTLSNCVSRVTRGGAWFMNPRNLRSALRIGNSPGYRSEGYGFRVARTL